MSKSPSYSDVTDEFEEVGSSGGEFAPTHDFEENDTLIGVYNGSREVNTRNGERIIHNFTDANGDEVDAWGAAIINSRLKDVPVGAKVKIVSTGQLIPTKNGRKAKEFKVFVAKGSLKGNA